MLLPFALVLALAPASPGPAAVPAAARERELLGTFRIVEHASWTWPGLVRPPFALLHGNRLVSRWSLGLVRPAPLRRLWLDVTTMAGMPASAGAAHRAGHVSEHVATITVAARVELPGRLHLSAGRTVTAGVRRMPEAARGPFTARGPMLSLGGLLR